MNRIRFGLLFLTCFIGQHLYSQNQARLYSDAGLFTVLLNDLQVNSAPQAEVLLKNVLKDTLYVKVAFENSSPQGLSLYFMDKGRKTSGKEFSYLLRPEKGKIRITFMGMHALMNPPVHLLPEKPVIDTSGKYRDAVLSHFCAMREGKPVFFNNIPSDGKCQMPMPEEYMSFSRLLFSKTQVPDERLRLAEDITMNNCLSTSQLTEILGQLDYEVEKLKFLRSAFFSLTDPASASKLESAFRFESSKHEFREFLANSEKYRKKYASACVQPSTVEEIQKFGAQLSSYTNDAQRIEAFRKIYEDYCYTADHCKRILSIFIHDREKLEAAKMLYYRCTEKSKYQDVAEVFSYNQTTSDLKVFLDKQAR
jgi:hypothetical protein